MSSRFATLLFLLLSPHASACGGITETGPPRPGEPHDPSAGDPEQAPQAGSDSPADSPIIEDGTAKDGGVELAPDSRPLGTCTPGPAPTAGAPCPWLAEGRCYASKDEACDCTCPQTGDSLCLSGLPGGADAQVEVNCL
jgi:hypothetical protein